MNPVKPPFPLEGAEAMAVRHLVTRVRSEVGAELVQASLFGSRARGEARPDSDIDVLLIFRSLPPGREPFAGHAEEVADEVAAYTGIPVSVWSVSLADTESGNRTPMLVDALEDSHVLWAEALGPLPPVRFGFADAVFCVRSLCERVREGSEEFARLMQQGNHDRAFRRLRDDLVRMCTGHLLLAGWTRPRRSGVLDAFARLRASQRWSPEFAAVIRWAGDSFGPSGRDDDRPVPPPCPDLATALNVLATIREDLHSALAAAERRLPGGELSREWGS